MSPRKILLTLLDTCVNRPFPRGLGKSGKKPQDNALNT
jgi:hypothetical protein